MNFLTKLKQLYLKIKYRNYRLEIPFSWGVQVFNNIEDMKKLILILLISSFPLQGCIPALIIGGVMAHNSSKKSRSQWNSEFNKNNTERQEHHLPALDYCEEASKVNLGWVDQDCKARLVKEGKLKPLKRNSNASH